MNAGMHPPALVLNADFRPLSYFPYLFGHGRIALKLYGLIAYPLFLNMMKR